MEDDFLELLAQANLPGSERSQLEPLRASEMLGRFQLSNPYFYVLKWVQWAVLACARQVWVEVLSDRVSVWHDGPPPQAPSARELLSLEGEWGHFGTGFFAATRLKPVHIALGSTTLFGKGVAAAQGVTVVEPRRKLDISNLPWRDLRLFLRPEAALVRFHCHYAPVPIYLNGTLVNRPLFGVSQRADGFPLFSLSKPVKGLVRQQGGGREWLAAPDWEGVGDGEFVDLQVSGRPCVAARAMFFYLPPGPKASNHSELSWVKDGVTVLKETRLADFPPGLHGVASCAGLELDASQFGIVRDEAYRQRMNELLEAFRGSHG